MAHHFIIPGHGDNGQLSDATLVDNPVRSIGLDGLPVIYQGYGTYGAKQAGTIWLLSAVHDPCFKQLADSGRIYFDFSGLICNFTA